MNLFETKLGNTIVFDKHKYGNAMRMFDHACDFSESADLIFEKHNVNKSCTFDYTAPAVVYYAFSCEIFLKTLCLCHDITYKKDHGLKGLYENLPNVIKERIYYKNYYKNFL